MGARVTCTRRFLLAASLSSGLLLGSCAGDPQGEVMVVITTDMAVPTDLDAIDWSVTLPGQTLPFQAGTITLASNEELPATLSVVGGPKTTEPVTIRIEGRRGAGAAAVRVSREARVKVPNDRVAELWLPLEWLCSEANFEGGCPESQTCQAGVCFDSLVSDAALPEYVPPSPRACFDVRSCFSHMQPQTPEWDSVTGQCVIEGTSKLGEDADLNLAFAVQTSAVGAHGFCGVAGECLIPLNLDAGRGGWQVSTQGTANRVVLPDAACDALGGSVKAVVAQPTSGSCPAKSAEQPPCSQLPYTCLESDICPSSSPEEWWFGYACSGSSTPELENPELSCLTPDFAANNGRWCCTAGQPFPDGADPLLIDDMSAGPIIKFKPPDGGLPGGWYTSLGDGGGHLSPPDHSLFTYRIFDPPESPDHGPEIRAAACLSSSGFKSWVAMEGFSFVAAPKDAGAPWDNLPFDVSPYSGLSFWGRNMSTSVESQTVLVDFPNVQTWTEGVTSLCWTPEDLSSRCGDNYGKRLTLTSDWSYYELKWDELTQSPDKWGAQFERFDRRVHNTQFIVRGNLGTIAPPFDFCIAHVYFLP